MTKNFKENLEIQKAKLRDKNKAYEGITNPMKLIAWVIRYYWFIIIPVLIAIVVLQYMHFDFSILKFK